MSDDARVRALREAVRIAPEDVDLRMLLGRALEADDPAAAADAYKDLLRLDPEHPDALLALARAYLASGRPTAALLAVEDLNRRGREIPPAILLHARLLAEQGDVEAATTAYRRAVELDPTLVDLDFAARLGRGASTVGSDGTAGPARPIPDDRARAEPEPATEDKDEDVDGDGRRQIRVGGDADDDADRVVDVERPAIRFADVGGMESVKDEIRLKIIAPTEHAELYAAYGKSAGGGILMYGPPGCGKTFLARATAGEMSRGFISVGIADVLDMWLGQSERNLRGIFETARAHRPCVLFFDEVDALAADRADLRRSAGRHVVNQFLSELDGIESSNEGVLTLAATNAPWHLDPAFRRPGRFDRVIFVPPPDAAGRAVILELALRGKPTQDVDHRKVADRLDLFSGADVTGLVDVVVERKLAEAMRSGIPTPIRTADLLDAAKAVTPTTREWFATARNHVLYANQGGLYDAVRPWLQL